MKRFCKSLREHIKNITNFDKEKCYCQQKKELKLYQDARSYYICGIRILKKLTKSKNYWKVRDHCHYTDKYWGAAHSVWNLRFNVPNEIPAVSPNGSNYDYHLL